MALTTVNALRTSKAQQIKDAVDAGTTNAAGKIVIMTGADATIVELTLSNPAFGAITDGVMSLNTVTNGTSILADTAALFKIVDRDENEVYRGTVTATGGGGDLELSTVTIPLSEEVAISSWTYTESA